MSIAKGKLDLMILPAIFFRSRYQPEFNILFLLTFALIFFVFGKNKTFSPRQIAKENEPAAEHTTFVRVTTFGSKKFGRCDYEDSESAPSDEEERAADEEAWFNPDPQRKEGNDKIGQPANIIEKVRLIEKPETTMMNFTHFKILIE